MYGSWYIGSQASSWIFFCAFARLCRVTSSPLRLADGVMASARDEARTANRDRPGVTRTVSLVDRITPFTPRPRGLNMRRSAATLLLAWTRTITTAGTRPPGRSVPIAARHCCKEAAVGLSRLGDDKGPSPLSVSPSKVAAARDAFLRAEPVPHDIVRQPILASWIRSAELLVEPESPELGTESPDY